MLTLVVLLGFAQARHTERVAFPVIFHHFNCYCHSGNSTAYEKETNLLELILSFNPSSDMFCLSVALNLQECIAAPGLFLNATNFHPRNYFISIFVLKNWRFDLKIGSCLC